ncbi:MAG: NfeD family protein [Verrucomicrobiota bacterium]
MLGSIIALIILGIVMIITEFILPGAVIGVIGGLCLLIAVGLSFYGFGTTVGTFVALGVLIVSIVSIALWMRFFDKMPLSRQFTLNESVDGTADNNEYQRFLNLSGVAGTDLRPAGKAVIDGNRLDVVAETGMIENGSEVKVVQVEGNRIVVRAI